MGRFIKFLAVVGFVLSFSPTLATAQTSCTITNTGAGSNNTCINNNSFGFTFRCTNGVLVNTLTNQQANSGNATVSGNTGGGSATSGSALNEGDITTNINATCAAAAAVNPPAANPTPSAPTVSPTQVGGRGGGGAAPMPAPASAAGIATLPETGSTTPFMFAAFTLVAGLGLAALVPLILSVYRRHTLARL
jgi:hypothetical protein